MISKYKINLILILFVQLILDINGQENGTFTNPIFDGNSADPSAHRIGSYYYLTLSTNAEMELSIFKSQRLSDFRNVESVIAFRAPENYRNVWASEMHSVRGELYIYFTMEGGGKDHRMYAIKANNPNDPMEGWSDAIRLMEDWDYSAIDGTIMKHGPNEDNLYFVFGSWSFGELSLYISQMADAITVNPSKLLLRYPRRDWEINGFPVNEGAYFIYNRNTSWMVFSASSTFDPSYCLGLMSIPWGKDPMNPTHWDYGPDHPVFWRKDEEDVYTTGHAAFTDSPDGTETWFLYHATVNPNEIVGHRIARIEKITWDEVDGRPKFPRPHGYNSPQQKPSGEP